MVAVISGSLEQKQQSGYIALMAILIIGAAAVAISLALLSTSTDIQRSTLVQQQSKQARGLAVACAQEALQQVHDSTTYTGTTSISPIGQGNCSYTVTNTGATTRTILATGTVGNIVRKIQVYVTIGSSSISITSWQEVS